MFVPQIVNFVSTWYIRGVQKKEMKRSYVLKTSFLGSGPSAQQVKETLLPPALLFLITAH